MAGDDAAALAKVAQHLRGKERVAVGLAAERVREPDTPVVQLVSGRRSHQFD